MYSLVCLSTSLFYYLRQIELIALVMVLLYIEHFIDISALSSISDVSMLFTVL